MISKITGHNSILKLLVLNLALFISFDIYSVEYSYDSSNRIKQVTYDNGTVVSYEYDADGNLTKVSPTESASGGGDTGGTDNGGGTGGTDNGTPDTPEPAKSNSGGGAFGLVFLFFTVSLIALRSRFKAKLKSS